MIGACTQGKKRGKPQINSGVCEESIMTMAILGEGLPPIAH